VRLLVVEKLLLRRLIGLCIARKRNVDHVSLVHDVKTNCDACKRGGCAELDALRESVVSWGKHSCFAR